FKLHVRWLHSVTRITYLSKLIGIPSLAAFLKLEVFRVYKSCLALSCVKSGGFNREKTMTLIGSSYSMKKNVGST
ncbi:hypothetical protein, partial [Pectobacterium brasiliense]|uniref:hypothetical protein n=1 Tax=Pectobacterium brasiliense TaxID=180957 RepID=UPI001CA58CA0